MAGSPKKASPKKACPKKASPAKGGKAMRSSPKKAALSRRRDASHHLLLGGAKRSKRAMKLHLQCSQASSPRRWCQQQGYVHHEQLLAWHLRTHCRRSFSFGPPEQEAYSLLPWNTDFCAPPSSKILIDILDRFNFKWKCLICLHNAWLLISHKDKILSKHI